MGEIVIALGVTVENDIALFFQHRGKALEFCALARTDIAREKLAGAIPQGDAVEQRRNRVVSTQGHHFRLEFIGVQRHITLVGPFDGLIRAQSGQPMLELLGRHRRRVGMWSHYVYSNRILIGCARPTVRFMARPLEVRLNPGTVYSKARGERVPLERKHVDALGHGREMCVEGRTLIQIKAWCPRSQP